MRKRKGTAAQSAVELTSSPYKRELEEMKKKAKKPKSKELSFKKSTKKLTICLAQGKSQRLPNPYRRHTIECAGIVEEEDSICDLCGC